VWREIAAHWPSLGTVYVADQAHIPYGPRPLDEIRGFARGITRFLAGHGCGTVVLACNTASAAALAPLRAEFPDIAFVGMEPAVKPAAAASQRRVAGVLATPATFQGELFATTVERFASDVRIVRQVCPGLVERIEAGDVDGPDTLALLREFLAPSLAAGADTIVLACTHYPFVRGAIERLAGPAVTVIDPAPAIARQVGRVTGVRRDGAGHAESLFYTTGDRAHFERVAGTLLGRPVHAVGAAWTGDSLLARADGAPTTAPGSGAAGAAHGRGPSAAPVAD
jgi:glutamate racemase